MTMFQASAQAVDFKVGRYFGEGQLHARGSRQYMASMKHSVPVMKLVGEEANKAVRYSCCSF